nr:hypothetical protein [uncultured Lichenicoccus sp.]
MFALSQYQDSPHQDGPGERQDPAERLAAALGRIAVAVERREAIAAEAEATGARALRDVEAAATQARLDAERAGTALREANATPSVDLPVLVANLDALIVRLRDVLGESVAEAHPVGDLTRQGGAHRGGAL